MGLSRCEAAAIEAATRLRDIGMAGIPDRIP
jgi:response regulator RpfG family c-di-GMP phosphodiesterase